VVFGHAEDGPLGNTEIYVVPEGHYFMMGDNRDNSLDSRVLLPNGPVGFVPFENLVGRAELIFYSTASDSPWWAIWDWVPATRLERLGNLLR
jgi:signal peptidase I